MVDLFAFLTSQLTFIVAIFSEGKFFYGVLAVAFMFFGYGLAALAIDTAFKSTIKRGFFIVAPLLATLSILVLAFMGAPFETIKYAVYSAMFMLGMMTIAGYPCIQHANKLRKIKYAAIKVNPPKTVYTSACASASLRYLAHPLCFALYVRSLKQYEQQVSTPITHKEQQDDDDADDRTSFDDMPLFQFTDDIMELFPLNNIHRY